ncbi:hypothetical protein ACWEWI_28275 [Streptomyces sp. NPDC003753]|uniref:hypothetical protein n=1 Tax=unclassified Streptomyces TaxID=2593676 RepID=UPI00190343A9|nr:hypothetical protein [Streptomyces sp. Y2F8-2]GHK04003.1 hypothetical protein SY2F82_58000 [Streptomyces sp. Y2F8-2]
MTTDNDELTPRSAGRMRTTPSPGLTVVGQFRPRAAVWTAVAGIALFALVGASAPNHNTLRAPITWLRLPAMPGAVSAAVTYAAIVLSCLGTLGLLRAHGRGWRPHPRLLFGAGALAVLVVANLTPVGSSDMASYAAYGRIAALGADPYVTTPAQLGGAYAHLVSEGWRYTPSVYGPVATWWQAAGAYVGGDRPWLTIWALMLANAAAFLGTGYLLIRTADDPVRAGLLWIANPLLIGVLVAGGHLDTIIACLTVCAIHFVRRATRWHHDLIVGGLVGLACGVKISAALLGAGLAWPLLRAGSWRQAARLTCAAALTLTVLYSAYGVHALAPLSAASQLVSTPSLWAVFEKFGAWFLGPGGAATATGVLWPVVMLVLAWALHRRVPADAPAVVAVPFALTFAWVLTAPWTMPWYTAVAWASAALFRQGRLTRYLVVTTALLAMSHNSGGHGWTL